MDTYFNQTIFPLIILSICAGILLIENLHYLFIFIFTKGKLYLSILLLGFSGLVFVISEILVITFGIMDLFLIGRFFHLLQTFTTTLFMLFLPLFLYYFLDLNYYLRKILKIIIILSIIFIIFLLFIIIFKPTLFLDFNKALSSYQTRPWNINRGNPKTLYLIRDILIGGISIISVIFLVIDLLIYKKYFSVLMPLIGLIVGIITGVIDIYFEFFKESVYGLYSIRVFSFFCLGVTFFIFLSMLGVMQKFIKQARQIENAMKLKSLGILAGGIAHDFNNILAAVIGNISLLKYDFSKDKDNYEKIVDIEKAVSKARGLTNQLLTFSKGGAPVKDITSIKDIIEDTVLFALSGSHVKVHFNIEKNLWNVNIDENQISQVIQNMALNAKDAMPDGGILTIKVSNKQIMKSVDNIKEGKYIELDIIDKGIGIPKRNIRYIFEPYYTTKEKGSGLGLFICYSIINNHDGYITVASEINKGTTFSIYLPAVEEQVKLKKKKTFVKIKIEGKVLILDDDNMILNMLRKMLLVIGLKSIATNDGNETLSVFKEHYENKIPFDLVILDLTIKGGIGGKDIIHQIKKIDPSIKTIVSSGYSNDPVMADYKKYGFDKVMKKPFNFEDLVNIIHEIFKK